MDKTIWLEPMGKPRQTQRDKWAKRPRVMRYRAFADEFRAQVGDLPEDPQSIYMRSFFAMPKSWSKKKKDAMRGMGHRQKPDIDNICKAVLDALLKDDSGICYCEMSKHWDDGKGARIVLRIQ